jgi:hypothetical protein
MGSIVTLPTARPPNLGPRLSRSTRVPLRRRLRAAYRSLAGLLRQIAAAEGHDNPRHEDFLQAASREARERAEAIDASVGAMSAADIRRIARQAPDRRRADTQGCFPY